MTLGTARLAATETSGCSEATRPKVATPPRDAIDGPSSTDGEMDTKPKDTKPEDLDLELAVFAAP